MNNISEMTDFQLQLLNLSQIYDVIQVAVDQYYGEDNDGVPREIPDRVLPYPGKLMKWYDEWKDKIASRRGKKRPSPTGRGQVTQDRIRTVSQDNDSDEVALMKYISARNKRKT